MLNQSSVSLLGATCSETPRMTMFHVQKNTDVWRLWFAYSYNVVFDILPSRRLASCQRVAHEGTATGVDRRDARSKELMTSRA